MAVKNQGKTIGLLWSSGPTGAQFLLTDEEYNLKIKKPHPKGNPNKALIQAMFTGGGAEDFWGVSVGGAGKVGFVLPSCRPSGVPKEQIFE